MFARFLGMLPVFLALLLCPGPILTLRAEAGTAQPGSRTISKIAVVATTEGIQVRIASGQSVTPVVSRLSHPERLVFDFPGFRLPGVQRIEVHKGPVLRVRASSFQLSPPVARVVIDLRQPAAYHVQSAGNAVLISIATKEQNPVSVANRGTPKPSTNRVLPPPAKISVPGAATAPVPNRMSAQQQPPQHAPSSAVPASPQPVPIPSWDWEPSPEANSVQVTFQNGLLTVAANNAPFDEIFREIGLKMRVAIEMPAMPERVLTSRGPAPPREVISGLLEGSRYNFKWFESRSGRLRKIIIVTKP